MWNFSKNIVYVNQTKQHGWNLLNYIFGENSVIEITVSENIFFSRSWKMCVHIANFVLYAFCQINKNISQIYIFLIFFFN